MFVFRVLFRKPWIAALVFVAFWSVIESFGNHHTGSYVAPAVIAVYAIAAFVVLRFGFVALAVGIFTVDMLGSMPITTDLSKLVHRSASFVVFLIIALAVWGCYTALAGQKLVKGELFE